MRPDVVLVPVLDAAALGQVDAERGAVERRLDVVGGQRVAGEQHVDEAGVDQRDHRGAAPVWTTPGPPTQSTFLPAALASRMPSATWRTSTACGFSLETSDSMKPNALVGPCPASGTVTLMPEAPQTTLHARAARRTSAACRRAASRRRSRRRSGRSPSPGSATCDPVAVEPHLGLEVGGGVEAVGEDAVHAPRRSTSASPGSTMVDAAGLQPHQQPLERLVVLGGDGDRGVRRVVGARGRRRSARST